MYDINLKNEIMGILTLLKLGSTPLHASHATPPLPPHQACGLVILPLAFTIATPIEHCIEKGPLIGVQNGNYEN